MDENKQDLYAQSLSHLLAPIKPLLDDSTVSEIMINGSQDIYVERGGMIERSNAKFPDEYALEAAMRNVAQYAGKRFVPDEPSIEARLPDGSRVHIVQAPAARQGLCVAIRKFSEEKLDLATLVEFDSLSAEAAEFLKIAVMKAKNIVISGGTGSGKTTLLNCLSGMIPSHERILVLEDSSELQLQQEHVVCFEVQAPDRNGRGGIDIRGLFKASLRMRPDRVVVGECRGSEALDMIQAMTSGHSGSLTTCHASTPPDALGRLETMSLMAGLNIPLSALQSQLASAIDIIVQINRLHDGSRRVTHITQLSGLDESKKYCLEDLFILNYNSSTSHLEWTGVTPQLYSERLDEVVDELNLTKNLYNGSVEDNYDDAKN